jgi:hypothetical protein
MERERIAKWVAFHEAGHAVLADYFDALESVALSQEQELAGHAIVYGSHIDDTIMAIVHWGGVLAQARYQKVRMEVAILTAGRRDMQFVRKAAARHPLFVFRSETQERIKESWRCEARQILSERWTAVKAVATALLEQRRLGKQAVRKLCC